MEKSSSLRYGFLLVLLVLLPGCIKADWNIEMVTDPTSNVNLSPFDQWRSAYECLQNISSNCPGNYSLNEGGWVNLRSNDTVRYCNITGCADHSRAVLKCICLVKRDFKFQNGATVKDINDTINDGCRSST
ncbi:hypothetical protein CKAN_02144800 [Cinnamomum micranthum f. kanehirae]|uniref:DUF7731 domain-containing protein n=1 Tax=Cinnamomum micranthum f. kanehirae TaxID=337451 RepID=A0A3S3P353_9MAGN|nr:hypothetical protein CKAN_02144800 [Cinnamomum micranthum f. kanehirae]